MPFAINGTATATGQPLLAGFPSGFRAAGTIKLGYPNKMVSIIEARTSVAAGWAFGASG